MGTNFIVGGNSTGKTRKLLEYAAQHDNTIVICRDPYRMKQKAEAYGIIGLKYISYSKALESIDMGEPLIDPYVVDEIADLIEYLLSSKCIGFTQTQEDDNV